jgi:hypothetical protein
MSVLDALMSLDCWIGLLDCMDYMDCFKVVSVNVKCKKVVCIYLGADTLLMTYCQSLVIFLSFPLFPFIKTS